MAAWTGSRPTAGLLLAGQTVAQQLPQSPRSDGRHRDPEPSIAIGTRSGVAGAAELDPDGAATVSGDHGLAHCGYPDIPHYASVRACLACLLRQLLAISAARTSGVEW